MCWSPFTNPPGSAQRSEPDVTRSLVTSSKNGLGNDAPEAVLPGSGGRDLNPRPPGYEQADHRPISSCLSLTTMLASADGRVQSQSVSPCPARCDVSWSQSRSRRQASKLPSCLATVSVGVVLKLLASSVSSAERPLDQLGNDPGIAASGGERGRGRLIATRSIETGPIRKLLESLASTGPREAPACRS